MNKILIVEDEAVVARDIERQLKQLNYDPVASTTSGEEALRLTEQLRPDLVLMDVQLAGEMDGIAAAQVIRDRFDVPVVFLSAFSGDRIIERAILTEPYGFIVKPLDDRDLRIVVATALLKHKAYREMRAENRRLRAREARLNQRTEEENPAAEYNQLHRQFIQSQKMEALGQLATGVAHDFNNILSAMMMHLHIYKKNGDTDCLLELEKELKSAANLTRQLLIFSRKEAIQTKSVNLNEVILNLLKMLQRLLQENIAIDTRLEPWLPPIGADTGMMEQVLTNLCVNARDAMPQGGVLSIKTEHVELPGCDSIDELKGRPGRYVRLIVSDTGCGIDDAVMSRLFEPFFTTKTAGKGTGLGLATVASIVKQHNGWIDVASQLGVGSTFTIHLPVLKSSDAQTLESRANDAFLDGRGTTILLVEDDASLRRITSLTLRNYGFKVYEAMDGQEAHAIWKEKRDEIKLILADMVMPGGMSGVELAAILRAEMPSLKVMITTGYNDDEPIKIAAKNANIAVIKKPYDAVTLMDALRRCLE